MTRGDRLLSAGLAILIGLPFCIVGGGVAYREPRLLAQTAAQIHQMPLATIATLTVPGETVLIEGTIDDRTPVAYPPLVAFNQYRWVVAADDDDSDWQLARCHTPALWVAVSKGLVNIQPGYRLEGASITFDTQRDTRERVPEARYEGIQVQDPVLMMGTLISPATEHHPPVIEADWVRAGSRQDYLVYLDQSQRWLRGTGILFMAFGLGPLAIAAALLRGGRLH